PPVEPIRPLHDAGLKGIVDVAFIGVHDTELVVCIEVMIEPHIELIPIGVDAISIRLVQTVNPARKANARCVQTIAGRVVVRHRHSGKPGILDKTAWIETGAEWIARPSIWKLENIEGLEIAGGAWGSDGIPIPIDRRVIGSAVLVVGA